MAHRAEPDLPRGRVVRHACATSRRSSRATRYLRRAEDNPEESGADKLTRELIWRWVTPRWRRHLEALVERERPDAVVVFTVPMAHFSGIPTALRERFGVPVVFYDGDVPMSLPEFGGMDTGFNYYHGADPSEYDLLVSNSEGGLDALRRWARAGRRRSSGAPTPSSSRRTRSTRTTTSSSTDTATSSAATGWRRWSASLRASCPTSTSRSAGATSRATPAARAVGDVPFNVFPRAISAARVNVCITRRSHATVYASSSCRPFELAASGAAIVANPYNGIERWFEPGSELLVVDDAAEAVQAYRDLLDDPAQAEEMGRRARERVLDEHTYRHRARQLLELVGLRAAAHVD